MAIKLTSVELFTEKLDKSKKGLESIDVTFPEGGEAAAEKQFADFIRNGGVGVRLPFYTVYDRIGGIHLQ